MVYEGIVLGHKVSHQGIEVDKAQVEVIEKLLPPTSVKGIQSFLGHTALEWTLPSELMCYASDYAVGAVLGKKKDKVFHAIYYVSRTLTDMQLNYTTIKKELLVVEFDLEIWERKGTENQVADDLSRIEARNKYGNVKLIKEDFPGEQLLVSMALPWYADIVNFLVNGLIPLDLNSQ
ncbi:uncharacterized protein LOC108455575 [Gossypium arboreum]|uniref:uncharacterized protein LOC108455575 n=1 Tax=Gossypium arboreum TaxID=29729 RepID=UPI00081907B7|nr:uncharacterized protein LOC108455575 [Gossypium arboreum]